MTEFIDRAVLRSLTGALEKMSGLLKAGTALVPSIEQALKQTSEPRVRRLLEEMLIHWAKDQNILPPLERRTDVVPRVVYWLSNAGFSGGLLEIGLARAATILRYRLKKIENTGPREAARRQFRFLYEFGALLGSGVSGKTALGAMAEDSDDSLWKKAVSGIAKAVGKGQDASAVLPRYPGLIRPEWLLALARSEKEGHLDAELLKLADALKKELGYL